MKLEINVIKCFVYISVIFIQRFFADRREETLENLLHGEAAELFLINERRCSGARLFTQLLHPLISCGGGNENFNSSHNDVFFIEFFKNFNKKNFSLLSHFLVNRQNYIKPCIVVPTLHGFVV